MLLLALLSLVLLICETGARRGGRSRYTSSKQGKSKRGVRGSGRASHDSMEEYEDTQESQPDAFDQMASFLHKSGGKAFKPFSFVEVRRAVAKLASSQAALKTMDGATHQFVNAFKEASTLASRHERFMSYETPKRKEAAKLYEYVTTVERSLQAAEICQAARNSDDAERKAWFREAGLEELKRIKVEHNNLSCVVSVLCPLQMRNATETMPASAFNQNKKSDRKRRTTPKAFPPGELVLCVVETGDTHQALKDTLRVMRSEGLTVPLRTVGFVSEEVTVQPTLVSLAMQALDACRQELLGPPAPASVSVSVSVSASAVMMQEETVSTATGLHESTPPSPPPPPPPFPPTQSAPAVFQPPRHIRLVGYSSGAAVAAYMGMVLDGSLDSSHEAFKSSTPFCGAMSKRVQCVCLAPPPCLSRTVVPRFVSSVLCGDDVVPRASPDSLSRLRERVLVALKNGAGKSGLSAGMGSLTSWVGDISSVATRSLQQYTAGQHDLSALAVPGRIFYCKSRSLHNGASIQRVMRGNWREDVLWLLHDVLLSSKMSDHHSLDYYIKCLARM